MDRFMLGQNSDDDFDFDFSAPVILNITEAPMQQTDILQIDVHDSVGVCTESMQQFGCTVQTLVGNTPTSTNTERVYRECLQRGRQPFRARTGSLNGDRISPLMSSGACVGSQPSQVGSTHGIDSEVREGSLGFLPSSLGRRFLAESRQTERQRRELQQLLGSQGGSRQNRLDADADMHSASGSAIDIDTVETVDVPDTVVDDVSHPATDQIMQHDDLGETTLDMSMFGGSRTSSVVYSASVVSFADGLPQGEPSFQRQVFDGVDQLVGSMHDLTLGRSVAASGQLRLSIDEPESSSLSLQQQYMQQQQQQQPQQQQQQQQQSEQQQQQQYVSGQYLQDPEWQQQRLQIQQQIDRMQRELERQHAIIMQQNDMLGTSATSSSIPDTGVDPLFGVQQFDMQQQQQYPPPPSQPVAEAGGGGGGGGGGAGVGAAIQGPSLSPEFVKLDRPMRFNGKHADLENFLFAMTSYIHSSNLQGQAATKFLVSYLQGDALTWWRQYCHTHGGLLQVHSRIDLSDLTDELRSQFKDINKNMTIRVRLFNIRQRTSVQQYTTLFRHLQCELGDEAVDDHTAMHLYLYGLKELVQTQVMLHMPSTFEDMVQLAERADQAVMQTNRNRNDQPRQNNGGGQQKQSGGGKQKSGGNQNNRGGNTSGGYQKRWQWSPGNQGNGGGQNSGGVRWDQSSQYNNLGYRGPAPMVLGSAQQIVCYQCGKPGHIKRFCQQNANNRGGRHSGGHPRGGHGGRPRGGMNMYANQLAQQGVEVSADLNNVLNLGVAAAANQERQRANAAVTFDNQAQFSDGTARPTKN